MSMPMEEMIAVLEVEVALLPAAGSRQLLYRPNHKHPGTCEFVLGQVAFAGDRAEPGKLTPGNARVLLLREDLGSLMGFGSWTIWEGAMHIGSVRTLCADSVNSANPSPIRDEA